MPTWEETKRAGQTAFIRNENDREAAHASVDSFYRQILTTGYVYPSREEFTHTQRTMDGITPESASMQTMTDAEIETLAEQELGALENTHDIAQEQDLEPER